MQNPTYTSINRSRFSTGTNPMPLWKVALDVLCCLPALPILGVLVVLMTIVTRVVSPGPVFFCQERIGYQGRRFRIYKFRTMSAGADTNVHQNYVTETMHSNAPMVKLDAVGDPRLIPFGWILRASGIDELPQIINVLRGEMSLVGPRPCIPKEFEHYLPEQRERVNAMPGLTGLWQVSGKNATTFEEMIRFDIQYARNLSLLLDLKIILLTPWTLVAQLADTRIRRKSAVSGAQKSIAIATQLGVLEPARASFRSMVPSPVPVESDRSLPTGATTSSAFVQAAEG